MGKFRIPQMSYRKNDMGQMAPRTGKTLSCFCDYPSPVPSCFSCSSFGEVFASLRRAERERESEVDGRTDHFLTLVAVFVE